MSFITIAEHIFGLSVLSSMILIFNFLFFIFSINSSNELVVNIEGLENNKGQVMVALYNSEKGFPDLQWKGKITIPSNQKAQVTFSNLPEGNYAVSFLHDENLNNKMDKNLVGYPKENFGFSNNPSIKFAAPKFKECTFSVGKGKTTISINSFF